MKTLSVVGAILSVFTLSFTAFAELDGNHFGGYPNGAYSVPVKSVFGVDKAADLPSGIEELSAEQLAARWDQAVKENDDNFRRGNFPLSPPEVMSPAGMGAECVRRGKDKKLSEKFPGIIHYATYPGSGRGGVVLISHEKDKLGDKKMPSDHFRKRNWKYYHLSAEVTEATVELGQLQSALARLQAQIKPPAKAWDDRVMKLNKEMLEKGAERTALMEKAGDDKEMAKKIVVLENDIEKLQGKKNTLLKGQDDADASAMTELKKTVRETQDLLARLNREQQDALDIELKENRDLWVEAGRDKSGQAWYKLREGDDVRLLEYAIEPSSKEVTKTIYTSLDNSHRGEFMYVKDPHNKNDPNAKQIIERFVDAAGTETICY